MPRTTLALVLLLTLVVAPPTPAAGSVRVLSDDALAATAAASVHARVVAIEGRWDAATGAIHTYVTLDVVEAWGVPLPSRIVLKQLGGRVGGLALEVGGAPRFAPGEEVLVFLEVRPQDGTLAVAGMEQGKWHVSDVPSVAGDVSGERPVDDREQRVKERRALADLRALAALAGSGVATAGRAPVAVPAELAQPAAMPPGGADGVEIAVAAAGEWTYLSSGTPARWRQADSGTPVPLDTASGGNPYVAGGGLTQLARAGQLWSSASTIVLPVGAARSPRCFTNSEPADGRISVTYTDPCEEIVNSSTTLAIGGYYTGGLSSTVNGVVFQGIGKGMVVTDNNPAKYASGLGCYEQMLAHEIGHAIGFGHSSDPASIMYPTIGACSGRTTSLPLGQSELNALAASYPVTLPGTPQGLQVTVSGSTIGLQWGAAAGAVASYVIEGGVIGQPPQSLDVGPVTGWSSPAPAGSYALRVRARNAAGYGPPTPDAFATVAPAVPLSAPQAFAATVSGSTVAMTWQPPASGAPLSYRLEAGTAPGLANVAVVPLATNALTVAGVPPGTYYVRVRAVDAAGAGPATSDVVVAVAPPVLPGAPTNLSAVVTGSTVQLSWSAPPGGASSYVLEAGYGPGLANAAVAPTVATGLVAGGVPPNVYYVRVRAATAAGVGPASTELVVTVR